MYETPNNCAIYRPAQRAKGPPSHYLPLGEAASREDRFPRARANGVRDAARRRTTCIVLQFRKQCKDICKTRC